MRRSVRLMAALGAGTAASAAALLISCLEDPRANDKQTVISECTRENLNPDPKSVDQSLRAYVDLTKELLTAAQEADNLLKDACLAVYADPALGIAAPAGATTAAVACQPLIGRIASKNKLQPSPPGLNVIPPWVYFGFDQRCSVPVGVREACLSTCGEPCDVSKCEDKNKLSGTCAGECLGQCSTVATDLDAGVQCTGRCIGEVALPNTGPPNFGSTCQGECVGTCGNGLYAGNCEGGCLFGFTGVCGGTCIGKCGEEGNPVTDTAHDAGSDAAIPPPSADGGAPQQDPTNAYAGQDNNPGNCKSICRGTCLSKANGSCYGGGYRCATYTKSATYANPYDYTAALAPFSAGQCFSPGTCIGSCRSSQGTGSVVSFGPQASLQAVFCKGECTEAMKPAPGQLAPASTTCAGTCRQLDPKLAAANVDAGPSPCSVDFTAGTAVCEGRLNCNQNTECSNACEAKAALATTCADPLAIEVYAVTDPALYNALRTNGVKLAKASNKLKSVQQAFAFIGNRTYGDFVALKNSNLAFPAEGDLGKRCAEEGLKNTTAAAAILGPIQTADPTTVKRSN